MPAFAADQPWSAPVVTEGAQLLPHKAGGFPQALTEMGLRTGRYAYFRYSTGEGELYDLATDPLQLRSRYDDPAYRDVRRDLAKLWRDYRFCAADECRPLPAYQVSVRELAKITARRATAIRSTTATSSVAQALVVSRLDAWRSRPLNHGEERRSAAVGVVGVLALAVQVAQEVGVVVGGDGASGRAALGLGWERRRVLGSVRTMQVDREREQGDEDQDLQHASRVGRRWSASTLNP